MHATDIVGYTYQAENFTPENLVEYMIRERTLSPAARDMNTEDVLDQLAETYALDREDEWSFDSGEFPKVIFASQLDEDSDSDWFDFS